MVQLPKQRVDSSILAHSESCSAVVFADAPSFARARWVLERNPSPPFQEPRNPCDEAEVP